MIVPAAKTFILIIRRLKTMTKSMLNTEAAVQRCSIKKGVLKNFTKFTGKHPCQSLYLHSY